MKKTFLTALIFATVHSFAQKNLYLGIEAGGNLFPNRLIENRGEFQKFTTGGENFGITLSYEIKNNILLETGYYKVAYSMGYFIKTPQRTTKSSYGSIISEQIPLRLMTRIKITEKVNFYPSIGYRYARISDYCFGNSVWAKTPSMDFAKDSLSTINGFYTVKKEYDPFRLNEKGELIYDKKSVKGFSLIEPRLMFEYSLKKSMNIGFNVSYCFGLNKSIMENTVVQKTSASETIMGKYDNNADAFSFNINLRYRFSTRN